MEAHLISYNLIILSERNKTVSERYVPVSIEFH